MTSSARPIFSEQPSDILAVGDMHGDDITAYAVFSRAVSLSVCAIYQLGDFGYFPNIPQFAKYLQIVSSLATRTKIPLYFIDGNHDDHFSLNHDIRRSSPVEVAPLVYWLPRGFVWSCSGVRFAALGGAYSTDHLTRKIGRDLFPSLEVPRARDYDNLFDTTCDVFLCHDVPHCIDLGTKQVYLESESVRRSLEAVACSLTPSILLHGHHHLKYASGMGRTAVYGLGCKHYDMFGLLHCDNGAVSYEPCD